MPNETLATNVVQAKNPSSLRIRLDCGPGDYGKRITKSRTYSNLKPTAADDVYNVADALVSLQENTVLDIAKIDNTSLLP